MTFGIKQNIDELLHREVNRKEFLMHVGAAAIAVVGINELIKNLTLPKRDPKPKTTTGYGMSAYGR